MKDDGMINFPFFSRTLSFILEPCGGTNRGTTSLSGEKFTYAALRSWTMPEQRFELRRRRWINIKLEIRLRGCSLIISKGVFDWVYSEIGVSKMTQNVACYRDILFEIVLKPPSLRVEELPIHPNLNQLQTKEFYRSAALFLFRNRPNRTSPITKWYEPYLLVLEKYKIKTYTVCCIYYFLLRFTVGREWIYSTL